MKRYVNEVQCKGQDICQPDDNHIIALAHRPGRAEIAAALGVNPSENVLTGDIRDRLLRDTARRLEPTGLVDVDQPVVTDEVN